MSSPSGTAAPADDGLDRDLMLIASVVVVGAIMSILDVTVVNVAINTLAREFATDLTTIQWVATGYTLALATVIPLTGWAADRSAPSASTSPPWRCSSPGRCSPGLRGRRGR